MADILNTLSQIGDTIGFFSNILGFIGGIAGSIASLVGITAPAQAYAIFAILLLITAFFMFRFLEIVSKVLIFVILLWVVGSIFGFFG